MKSLRTFIVFALFVCAGTLCAFEIPLNGKYSYNKKIITAEFKDKCLVLTIPKQEKKSTFAGFSVLLSKPENLTGFTGVEFTIKASQPIKAKCSFGNWKTQMSVHNWPGKNIPANTETKIRYERKLFNPTKGLDGAADKASVFSFGFGLWMYDNTKEDLVIEISGAAVCMPETVPVK